MHASESRGNPTRGEAAAAPPLPHGEFFKVAMRFEIWQAHAVHEFHTPEHRVGRTNLGVSDQDAVRVGGDDRIVPRGGRAASGCRGLLLLERDVVRRALNNRQVRARRDGQVHAAVRVLLVESSSDGFLLGRMSESVRFRCIAGKGMQRRTGFRKRKRHSRWQHIWSPPSGGRMITEEGHDQDRAMSHGQMTWFTPGASKCTVFLVGLGSRASSSRVGSNMALETTRRILEKPVRRIKG